MILFLAFVLSTTSDLSHQYSREWQSCIIQTSKLWAGKKSSPDHIADAAIIYCRDKFELYAIVQNDRAKELGLNNIQAAEYTAFLGASLLRLNRHFAIEAINKAREK